MNPAPFYSTENMGAQTKAWIYRLVAAAVIPAILFGGAEIALRVSKPFSPASFFIEEEQNGQMMVLDNPGFGISFFTPRQVRDPAQNLFPREKPAGVERVLVIGESAAMGFPRPEFGLAQVLLARLTLEQPERKFDVIDGTMTMINSHILRDIAREAMAYRPDHVVIHMGNNEVIGPYGPVGVFGKFYPALWMIRLDRWLRVNSAIVRQAYAWRNEWTHGDDNPWRGLDYFLRNPVPHDDRRLARMRSYFRTNLREIIDLSIEAGARVYLATPAVNLSDWPPLFSFDVPVTSTASNQPAQLADEANALMQAGKWPEALRAWQHLAAVRSGHAASQYQLAACLEENGFAEEARLQYERAAEYDGFRFRADAALARIIREEATNSGNSCMLVDARTHLRNKPGEQDHFLEHVHFSTTGMIELAGLFSMAIHEPERIVGGPEITERVFLLPDFEYMAWSAVSQFLQLDVFHNQPGYADRLNAVSRNMQTTAADASRMNTDAIRQLYANADPTWRIHGLFGRYMLNRGENREAAEALKKSVAIKHNHADTWELLGIALQRSGDLSGAIHAFEQAIRLNQFMPESWNTLGLTWYLRGSPEIAEKHYQKALALSPAHAGALNNLGYIWYERKLYAEAIRFFEKALDESPDLMEARFHLAVSLMAMNQLDKAERLLGELTRQYPDLARAWSTWGVLAIQRGDLEKAEDRFKRALAEDPRQWDAAKNLAALYRRNGMPGKAIQLVDELARLGVTSPELERLRQP